MQKTCEICDHYAAENIRHFVMQCPAYAPEREHMFIKLGKSVPINHGDDKRQPQYDICMAYGERGIGGISNAEQNTMMEVCGYFAKCI